MTLSYAITPFTAWLVAGGLKFLVNSIRAGKPAFGLIGYGGFPSNHSAIVSSMCALIALLEGVDHPAFGVALTVAFIVMLDASSLRQQVGKQAASINRLTEQMAERNIHRERMGHTPLEIAGGVLVGIAVGVFVACFS
ncbi:divergent PAP2 family protein [Marinobacter nauticus]|uniref:Acid phosphatase/vanadium-dependent haloperoxidase related protein n=1 Tax=Marinobacter nauticus (strain ATCC 700491 / DSM 11845 / VT8) TaxID=351348 RepID=A1U159_MARN8|nr:divergent PAP2 family protein [Marinobacter nauticus]ABM18728.1 acid phosphatase/vanadium-dependent haloperoxidase related protein [Marinobacter nauticus VT8]